MDDFREWLSDNLRYFMLGGGILLVLLLIFFGIRMISGYLNTDDQTKELPNEQIQEELQEEPETDTSLEEPVTEPEVPETPVVSDALEKNAVPEIYTLISTYYNALSAKDVETIRSMVDTLPAEDEATILASTVEGYCNINVYTKARGDGSYVTFTSYKYKLAGISTLVPGVAQTYVRTAEDGKLYISSAAPDADTQAFIDAAVSSSEVQALVTQIQADYEAALASDATLHAYFNPQPQETPETPSEETAADPVTEEADVPQETTPEDAAAEETPAPDPEPEYETVVLKKSANFRDAPDNDSNVIRGIVRGTEMLKLGEGGGWFHVRIDGVDGYIAARFF